MNLLHLASHLLSDRAQAVALDIIAAVGLLFIPFAAVVTVAWIVNLTP